MTDEPQQTESTPRTRLFRFPGGVLELRSHRDGIHDVSGFYLELHERIAVDGHENREVVMLHKPTCLGYLRTDVSGGALLRDQSRIRELAARLGYDFADMVVYDPKFGRPPLARLKTQARRLDAEAVIVLSPRHFEGGEIPESLVRQLDVITVSPEATYARQTTPPLRSGFEPPGTERH
ncbi:hypothetical protein [Nocardia sp. NPDC056100]|uniref:hypothetical protein n=1 Tax=Nocardia sp. NPDC056100 TaxID=3345712 RepID=UPI0035DE7440